MGSQPTFGSPVSPVESLRTVGLQLAEWFDSGEASHGRLTLRAVAGGLPDIALSHIRDRRLFSRTQQLVVEARQRGPGPAGDAALAMRTRTLRRRWELEWVGEPPPSPDLTGRRFVRCGLVEGARSMTNVRELILTWSASGSAWKLRLVTLAGAVVGTSPGAAITVRLEPEDCSGLIAILRSFRSAAAGG